MRRRYIESLRRAMRPRDLFRRGKPRFRRSGTLRERYRPLAFPTSSRTGAPSAQPSRNRRAKSKTCQGYLVAWPIVPCHTGSASLSRILTKYIASGTMPTWKNLCPISVALTISSTAGCYSRSPDLDFGLPAKHFGTASPASNQPLHKAPRNRGAFWCLDDWTAGCKS